jgi:hypothetical protein
VGEGANAGVDGELQIDLQVVLRGPIAQLAEALERACLVRLGAHDQHLLGAEPGRDLEEALGNADGLPGLKAEKLGVEDRDARVGHPPQGFP